MGFLPEEQKRKCLERIKDADTDSELNLLSDRSKGQEIGMAKKAISGGVVHDLPADIRKALTADLQALAAWEDLTSLARNEWICWITFVKKKETRAEHSTRMVEQLKEGKRRPCCWIGCIHRTDKPISPSVRAVLERRTKKSKKKAA